MDLLTSTKPNDRTIKADRLVQIDYNLGQIKWNSKPLPPTPEPFSSIRILKWGGGGEVGVIFRPCVQDCSLNVSQGTQMVKRIRVFDVIALNKKSGCLIEYANLTWEK